MKVAFLYPGAESVGVQALAAFLEQHGHACRLFYDPKLFAETTMLSSRLLGELLDVRPALLRDLEAWGPDVACFSVVTDEHAWALQLAREVKARLKIPVVFGGIHPTSVPGRVMREQAVDYVIRGEGEHALLELIEHLHGTEAELRGIANLCYRRGDAGEVVINDVRPLIADLDTLPPPDKELFYAESEALRAGYLAMTTRGCPFRCTYCNNSVIKRLYGEAPVRRRSVAHVLAELEGAARRYGFDHVKFIDEQFIIDRAWLRAFAAEYPRRVGLPFFISAHPNTIDEEVLALLKRAGCYGVVMGVQSTDTQLNREVFNRRTTTAQITRAIELIMSHDLKLMIDLIFGAPGLTEEQLRQTLEVLDRATPDFIRVFWLTYYPGTEIVELAAGRGLLTDAQVERIEQALDSRGFIKGGDTHRRALDKYATFLLLYPVLPRAARRVLRETGLFALLGLVPAPVASFALTKAVCAARDFRYHTYAERVKLKYLEFLPRILTARLRAGLGL